MFLKISQISLESHWRLIGVSLLTLLNKVIEKRLQHKCFPVKLVKFLRTLILKNNCERLLLSFRTYLRTFSSILSNTLQRIRRRLESIETIGNLRSQWLTSSAYVIDTSNDFRLHVRRNECLWKNGQSAREKIKQSPVWADSLTNSDIIVSLTFRKTSTKG